MQTFVPWPDLARSAEGLDGSRLGKQRVETLQLLRAMCLPDYGWQSHPALRMWRGHRAGLVAYGLACVDEWVARGGADSTRPRIVEFAPGADAGEWTLPSWWGREDVHRSHRCRLVAKDPDFYASRFPDADPSQDYVWPEPDVDEPATAPAPDERAWRVRTGVEDDRVAVSMQAPPRTPVRRWDAALRTLEQEVAPGATVLAPAAGTDPEDVAGRWRVGRVGALVPTPGHVVREVTWTGEIARTELVEPWWLQSPSVVAPVRWPQSANPATATTTAAAT